VISLRTVLGASVLWQDLTDALSEEDASVPRSLFGGQIEISNCPGIFSALFLSDLLCGF
jgi:hypothetical protein